MANMIPLTIQVGFVFDAFSCDKIKKDSLFGITGSGKDDFSSSTQKQSIDTIATSRNTSLKQYKLNKSFTESTAKAPSFLIVGSSALRFCDRNDTTNCHACLTHEVTNSNINILSDCNINEIHLNIFPPSATYVKEAQTKPQCGYTSSQVDETPRGGYLNIDVREKVNPKTINAKEPIEGKPRRLSLGHLSHISLKRCDSILHISIGNSSKITKRHKRKTWFLARLWKFPLKKKSPSRRTDFFSPQINNDGIYRLSNGSLNIINDELMISINSRSQNVPCTSSDVRGQNLKLIEREDFSESFTSNDESGANELDCYMNEIKRREMR